MDSLIAASARALAAGDVLGALNRVALRGDPPALALRGIAMAQLGELHRARELLRLAARAFGVHEEVARARCTVAAAEVALALRDLGGSPRPLAAAAQTLDARGDRANAAHARLIAARRLILLGRLDEAGAALDSIDFGGLPPALVAVGALAGSELALRRLRIDKAAATLQQAHDAASQAAIPSLMSEVAQARAVLDQPAARVRNGAAEQPLRLREVGGLLARGNVVVDACRHGVHADGHWLPLARRPILFTLLRELASAWPADVDRNDLIAAAFRMRRPDETHRARLRVEIGRLRALVRDAARIDATPAGFRLVAGDGRSVVLLSPMIEDEQAGVLALLADGAAWSTSALALALSTSQRTVQRALAELEAAGCVRATGRARARRWVAPPLTGFATTLLLPRVAPPA